MEKQESGDGEHRTTDIGERFRTWRMFLSAVRWSVGALAILLLGLLILRGHG